MEQLDFEKPIYELVTKLEEARKLGEDTGVDVDETVEKIESKLSKLKSDIYGNLSAWQRVQISRHPKRPYTLDYINKLTEGDFIQLHGDRTMKDDRAMIGGWGSVDGNPMMFIGQQKGRNTKDRQFRNFGMANPEGYRKALRLMRMAEKFNRPVVCLIDTPGAYPGLEAEERGQGEAIARNIYEMAKLKVPIICIIIGEGASGGALGIGVGDRVTMLENSWYSVISPENCSTILWRSWSYKEQAAEALKLTSENMKANNLVDHILPEPEGGAHYNPEEVFATVKEYIISEIKTLQETPVAELVDARIEKFCAMGVFEE